MRGKARIRLATKSAARQEIQPEDIKASDTVEFIWELEEK
jgi:hypothetical protein